MRILLLAPFALALVACGGGKPAATATASPASSTTSSKEKPPTAAELKKAFMDECTKGGDVSPGACICSYDAIISVKGTLEADLDANDKAAVHKKVTGCMAGELEEIYMKSCAKPGEDAMGPFCKCTYPGVAARVADGGDVDVSLRNSLYLSCGTLYPEARAKTDFVESCKKEGAKEETCTCAFKALKAKTKLSNGALSTYADEGKKDIQANIAACAKKPASK
jgi:hypothetical protein